MSRKVNEFLARRRLSAKVLAFTILAGPLFFVLPITTTISPSDATTSSSPVVAPLAGSVVTPSAAWSTVLMGKTSGSFNLFWELFSANPTTGRLALATPPGVADNGGLMITPTTKGTTALVGFGASQQLQFSPLAITTNGGRTWNPGGLPDSLVRAPSVIGFDESGSALALVASKAQTVIKRVGSLTSWKTLVTEKALAATSLGKRCAIDSLEAVALDSQGAPLIGASCQSPGIPGVFVNSAAKWHLANIVVPIGLRNDAFSVLRLQANSALLAAVHNGKRNFVGAWKQSATDQWQLSPPLAPSANEDVLATGTGPGTTQFVLFRSGTAVRAEIINGPGADWHLLSSLPPKTATIVISPGGQVEALSVNAALLTVWRLDAHGVSWTKVQSITVPIAYGSSG